MDPMIKKSLFLSTCLLHLLIVYSFSQENVSSKTGSLFEQFYLSNQDIIDVEISTDMRKLIKQKHKEIYQPGTFSYYKEDSTLVTLPVEIKTRGNSRKQICFYPPLKLKFKKSILAAAGLSDFNKIKLVHQCRSSNSYGEYIFQEYIAYELYHVFSPHSFRVKLLRINYKDTSGKAKPKLLYGFLIEPLDELTTRLDAVVIKRKKIYPTIVQKEPTILMAAFQYMIGNTDWSISNLHNLKLIKTPEYPKPILIPYDFDYSGLVNASYAKPHESLSIKKVTDRLYRGQMCTSQELSLISTKFKSHKDSFLNTCDYFSFWDKNTQSTVRLYLKQFLEILDNEVRLKNIFGGF